MARDGVERLESLLRRSFDGENTQSLIGNLAKVRAEDWDWVPPNGERSVRRIFEHAVIAKHIYTKFLFSSDGPRGVRSRASARRRSMVWSHGRAKGTRRLWPGCRDFRTTT